MLTHSQAKKKAGGQIEQSRLAAFGRRAAITYIMTKRHCIY
jgi:glycine cleavage system regulatory protein